MGRFRGNKQLTPAQVVGGARRAIQALANADVDGFMAALENPAPLDEAGDVSPEAVQQAFADLAQALGAR